MRRTGQMLGLVVAGGLSILAAIGSTHLTVDNPVFTGQPGVGNITVGAPAPDFALTDALTGRPTALHQFLGRPVVLCFMGPGAGQPSAPATVVRTAWQLLGPRARQVAWVGVNADALPVSPAAVAQWVKAHGLSQGMHFLTGNLLALEAVWSDYAVNADVVGQRPQYTSAVYVLSATGAEEDAFVLDLTPTRATTMREARTLVRDVTPLISASRR
jgi:cytochrome oxidase Cu insertion factor (SCO1/SenC/PrrC family)